MRFFFSCHIAVKMVEWKSIMMRIPAKFEKLRQALRKKGTGSSLPAHVFSVVLFFGMGILMTVCFFMIMKDAAASDAFLLAMVALIAVFFFGLGGYSLWLVNSQAAKVRGSWLRMPPQRLEEMEAEADQAKVLQGSVMFDEDMISRTPEGDIYLAYEDILWLYPVRKISRINGIPIAKENSVCAVDIEGNEFSVMRSVNDDHPAEMMYDVLQKQLNRAGYYPVLGFDAQLKKDTKKDLNVLKRRYEESMNEGFAQEEKAAKWICPHCTAENEGTDRCIYCGCLREMVIPEQPQIERQAEPTPPEAESDYSYLEPNAATRPKKNNPMLAVLLGVACVAVMGIALLVANMMDRGGSPSSAGSGSGSQPDQQEINNALAAEDDKLLDGRIGDQLSTAFFDFSVSSVQRMTSYQGMTPAEGNEFIVANIWLHNTMRQSLPMFDSDFLLVYGDGDNDYVFPVTMDAPEKQTGNMLASQYSVGINKEITGDLVFEVPKGSTSGFLYFEEYFDNGETGEYYTVGYDLD